MIAVFSILGFSLLDQDPRRIEKTIQSEPGRDEGEVALLHFDDQDAEAKGIADLCTHLMTRHGLKPDDILVLLRADRNGKFSRPIREKLERAGIAVAATTNSTKPLDKKAGRAFLAFLRIAVRHEDNLAWRSLVQVWCQGVGPKAIGAVYDLARSRGENFAQIVIAAHADARILPTTHRSRLYKAINAVLNQRKVLFDEDSSRKYETRDELMEVIRYAAVSIIANEEERDSILLEIERAAEAFESTSIKELVQVIEVKNEVIEQEQEEGKVNILTMHRAKGLTAEAVIVAAAEDQYIPGQARR